MMIVEFESLAVNSSPGMCGMITSFVKVRAGWWFFLFIIISRVPFFMWNVVSRALTFA